MSSGRTTSSTSSSCLAISASTRRSRSWYSWSVNGRSTIPSPLARCPDRVAERPLLQPMPAARPGLPRASSNGDDPPTRRRSVAPRPGMGRRVVGLLERLGMGPRVLKTAIAASLAWWIGNLLGEPQPVLAAVAAIVGLEPTVASSLARAGEQLVGMLAGLALAAFMLRLSGSAPLAVFLLILLATTIGARLRLRQAVIVEFSITALVVVTFTDVTHPYYGITRIWEGVLGGALAVLVNALVLPPEYHGQLRGFVQRSTTITLEALRWGLDDLLDGASADVAAEHFRRVADELGRLAAEREALERARDALRFSPL